MPVPRIPHPRQRQGTTGFAPVIGAGSVEMIVAGVAAATDGYADKCLIRLSSSASACVSCCLRAG
jgi:hypothetical protein